MPSAPFHCQRRTAMTSPRTAQPRPDFVSSSGRRRLRFVPAIAALGLVCLTLYASQASLVSRSDTRTPTQANQGDAAAAKALAVAKSFLDSLNADQRAKAAMELNTANKSRWS